MEKLIYQYSELIQYLEKQTTNKFTGWFGNYILHKNTHPMQSISPFDHRSSIVKKLYNLMKYNDRKRLKDAIIVIYYSLSYSDYYTDTYRQLLIIIGSLKMKSLISDLIILAKSNVLKKICPENTIDNRDMHYQLLETLFLLTIGTKEQSMVDKIAKSNIDDTNYLLLCFYYLQGRYEFQSKLAVYIPNLLMNIDNEFRNYKEAIVRYLIQLNIRELKENLDQISILIDNFELKRKLTFISILEELEININYRVDKVSQVELVINRTNEASFYNINKVGNLKSLHLSKEQYSYLKLISKPIENDTKNELIEEILNNRRN